VFQRARCAGADLRGARLDDADLSYADLGGADLRDAHFLRTRLHRAEQAETRFSTRAGIIEHDLELHKAQAWSDAP